MSELTEPAFQEPTPLLGAAEQEPSVVSDGEPYGHLAQWADAITADQAAVAVARGARIRNIFNKTARVFDFVPTALDPTTALEAVSFVAKAANAIPEQRRERLGRLGRILTRIAKLDPVPDVPAETVLENFVLELGTQVVPSWYRTSKEQIKLDNERIREGREAKERLLAIRRSSGWLAMSTASGQQEG